MKKNIFLALFNLCISLLPIQLLGEDSSEVKNEQITEHTTSVMRGDWTGELHIGSMKLTLVLHIVEDPFGKISATLDCVEQNAFGIPIDFFSFKDSKCIFQVSSLQARFEGECQKEENVISGVFYQSGLSLPITFQQGLSKKPNLSSAYIEKEVSYKNPSAPDVTLSGTLTLPKGTGPFPTVLLIAGSGVQDRNEQMYGHKPFLVLADHLTRQNIGVLRVDKRGCGKSTGNYALATTEDLATDALAGISYLKSLETVDSTQIGLIGHSEGGLIASMLAAESNDVAFIVLLAAPGVTGEKILLKQGTLVQQLENVPEKYIALENQLRLDMFAILKQDADIVTAEKKLQQACKKYLNSMPNVRKKELEQTLNASIQQMNTPWFRFFLTFDPVSVLQQVKIPVLALNGALDKQVDPKQNLTSITKALEKAGNKEYTIVELPHLNHLFQTSVTGSPSEYPIIEETISPKALHCITDWIQSQITKK